MSTSSTPSGPILVVGGAGYIGSHTVRVLEGLGVPAIVLDDLSTGHRTALQGPFCEVDLGDRAAVRAVIAEHKPVAVIHFAARCYVGDSVTQPALYYKENVHKTWCLLEEMRAAGIRDIIFSSSCATYGEPTVIPIPDDHVQVPINPYGRTKLHMEHMMGDYARAYGLRYAALRYFNAAGAMPDGSLGEDHRPETHLIPLVLRAALGDRDKVMIFGDDYPTPDGTCIRDYIHVLDLADAHLRALALLQGGGESFTCNLGTGNGFSVREIIDAARGVTGHAIPEEVAPRREGDPAVLVSGGTRAGELLGWTPARAELRTILEDAWRFHTANPQGYDA